MMRWFGVEKAQNQRQFLPIVNTSQDHSIHRIFPIPKTTSSYHCPGDKSNWQVENTSSEMRREKFWLLSPFFCQFTENKEERGLIQWENSGKLNWRDAREISFSGQNFPIKTISLKFLLCLSQFQTPNQHFPPFFKCPFSHLFSPFCYQGGWVGKWLENFTVVLFDKKTKQGVEMILFINSLWKSWVSFWHKIHPSISPLTISHEKY